MNTKHINLHTSNSICPALSGFAILSLCANALDAAAAQFSHLSCVLAGELFKVLPSIMLSALQAFETYALDHAQFLAICHMLVCAWPVLHFVFRAA
ncbi:MAG: hypothetical protein ABLT11_11150 [Candidatus Acidiferrum sp.]